MSGEGVAKKRLSIFVSQISQNIKNYKAQFYERLFGITINVNSKETSDCLTIQIHLTYTFFL